MAQHPISPQRYTHSARLPGLRAPSTVMRLARLGAFHQTRLSFMRVLLRRLNRDNWKIARTRWEVNHQGVGVAVYTAAGPERSYSLIAFAHDLDPSKRSDRVIAEEWDATFTLFDGVPNQSDIDRLARQVPLQEAGRISGAELSLSRANRSVRLFNYVRNCLSRGQQPEASELDSVGYLMRTTAVYGSAKFGACDRRFIAGREEFSEPFQAELLSVFMIRAFSSDIVEHLAAADNPAQAVKLNTHLKRRLGIGNSTGLGMAPFLINHPTLLNNWMVARETAFARVRSLETAQAPAIECFHNRLERQINLVMSWLTDHAQQQLKIDNLVVDLKRLRACSDSVDWHRYPWQVLSDWCDNTLSLEAQECFISLVLEPYPQLVDELAAGMSIDETIHFAIDGQMTIAELNEVLQQNYGFADAYDTQNSRHAARFWYVSEEKLEPRLGQRFVEPGAERENPLATARDIVELKKSIALSTCSSVADFLLHHPQHRYSVRRVQQSVRHPYAEIADNLIGENMLPIDLLRCKLSFFGAVKFDPKSDRWVRITMYQHAPTIEEIGGGEYNDDWIYPPLEPTH